MHGIWLLPRTDSDASTQARVRLEPTRYLQRHWGAATGWLGVWGSLVLALVATEGTWRSGALVACLVWSTVAYLHLRKVAAHAWLGDVCPAVTMSSGLAATYSNLTLQDGYFPVLRAFAAPVRAESKATFAVICWYDVSDQTSRCWSELEPRLIEELTSNLRIAAELRNRVSQELWDELDAGMQSVSVPAPGLYPLPGGDWPEEWVGTTVSRQVIEERFTVRWH
jgi:hypothetical protein